MLFCYTESLVITKMTEARSDKRSYRCKSRSKEKPTVVCPLERKRAKERLALISSKEIKKEQIGDKMVDCHFWDGLIASSAVTHPA